MKPAVRGVLLTIGFAAGTTMLGWWTVPIVGFAAGAWLGPSNRPIVSASGAAVLAWMLLLGHAALAPGFGRLLSQLESLLALPGPLLLAATLAMPALLAGAGALVGQAAVRRPTAS